MFEKLLSRGERRFGRYFGIPKLMMILCIGMGVTYVADYLLAAYNISLSYYLMFDREAIFTGKSGGWCHLSSCRRRPRLCFC